MSKLNQTLFFTLLSSLSFALVAEEVQPKDLENIVSLQRRADKLAFGNVGSNDYHLAKARAWLDMATSEYHQTDTSGILPAAISQAETLITALENGQANIGTDMPMDFPGSEKVRTDLWEKVTAIKSKGNATCWQRQLAEGEVQLIWAGHEKVESGWGHAEPYARIAENSIAEAQVAINICNDAANATANTVAAPVVPSPVPAPSITHVIENITLSADALFDFDKSTLTRYSRARLDKLVRDIKQVKSLEEVILVGHTDRLRTDGKHKRNQILSEKRAQRIKQYLVKKGISVKKIHASGVGSKQPLVKCSTKKRKAKQIVCLKPNRRVEITILGVQ